MKHFYSVYKRIIAVLPLILAVTVNAQNPTTVVPGTTCTVVQNFNSSALTTQFSSPSIHAGEYDYQFLWKDEGGNGILVSSSAANFPGYEASLISDGFFNTAPDGTVSVGFTYSAPPGTLYRIRVIRPNGAAGDILAVTSEGPPTEPIVGTPKWTALPSSSGTLCLQVLDADLHPNQTYLYEFTFHVTSPTAPITFDDFALNSSAPAPLPVNFLGVVADRTENGIKVRWHVGDEIDVNRYEVERSTDARNFTTVGTIDAKQKRVYSFIDENGKAEEIFYRIKSVDIDGTVKRSGIVRFKNNTTGTANILTYPSPVNSLLTVQHQKLGSNAKLVVSTIDGRILKTIRPNAGITNTMVDVSGFSTGMYILKLDDGKGKIQTSAFIKQ